MSQASASCYLAEKIKFRHTITKQLFWIMPCSVCGLAMVFGGTYMVINSYNWWYMAVLPGMLALVCSLTGQKDKKLKNRAVLSLPVDLGQVWDAKVRLCIRALLFSNMVLLLLAQTAGGVMRTIFHIRQVLEIPLWRGTTAMAILTVVCVWQVPFCLWLTQTVGLFPSLCITLVLNAAGGVIGAVTDAWFLNPFAIPARLMCAVLHILPNGLAAEEGSVTYTPEMTDTSSIIPGILLSMLWFLLVWRITRLWYERKGAVTP